MEGTKHFAPRGQERERGEHAYRQVSLQDGVRLLFAQMVTTAQSEVIFGESDTTAEAREFLEETAAYFADRPGVVGCGRRKKQSTDHGDQPKKSDRKQEKVYDRQCERQIDR